jgi:hypothetical protein
MDAVTTEAKQPELKQIVAEASRALAHLDVERLEELALSCQALNRDLPVAAASVQQKLAIQARAARGEMATFARVLEATSANLRVIHRLRDIRMDRLEYGQETERGWAEPESAHGND